MKKSYSDVERLVLPKFSDFLRTYQRDHFITSAELTNYLTPFIESCGWTFNEFLAALEEKQETIKQRELTSEKKGK